VQVWLGHHSPAFPLATYVHLLPDDLPDPESLAVSSASTLDRDEPLIPMGGDVNRAYPIGGALR
jgi:hypothetical protein